jgi:hypothetical protein
MGNNNIKSFDLKRYTDKGYATHCPSLEGDFFYMSEGKLNKKIFDKKDKQFFSIPTVRKLFPKFYQLMKSFLKEDLGFISVSATPSLRLEKTDIHYMYNSSRGSETCKDLDLIDSDYYIFFFISNGNSGISEFFKKELKEYNEKLLKDLEKEKEDLDNKLNSLIGKIKLMDNTNTNDANNSPPLPTNPNYKEEGQVV